MTVSKQSQDGTAVFKKKFKELHWHSPVESEENHEEPVNTMSPEDKCRALPLHRPDSRRIERKQNGKRE
jgi:hypothetical protein